MPGAAAPKLWGSGGASKILNLEGSSNVEVGFLDHPHEGPYLASEEGREAVAGALAKAVEDLRARELRARTDPSITARPPPPRSTATSEEGR